MTSDRPYEENAKYGAKGGKATKKCQGQDYYKKIGREGGLKGGKAVKAKYGKDYFRQIALKRWQAKELNKGVRKDGNSN